MTVPGSGLVLAGLPFLAMAAGTCLGVGRAIALDRWPSGQAAAVWRSIRAGILAGAIGLPVLWTLTAFGQAAPPGIVGPTYVGLLLALYAFAALLPRYLLHQRLEGDVRAAERVAVGTSIAFLVLVYPAVDFVNNCLVGAGVLFPTACA